MWDAAATYADRRLSTGAYKARAVLQLTFRRSFHHLRMQINVTDDTFSWPIAPRSRPSVFYGPQKLRTGETAVVFSDGL